MAPVFVAACAMLLQVGPPTTCLDGRLPRDGGRAITVAGKGVELHSWRAKDGTMRFSLLWGTNRLKTEAEVKSASCTISSTAQLRIVFSRLANGERVFWLWDPRECPSCSHPDRDVVDQVLADGRDAGITIETNLGQTGK